VIRGETSMDPAELDTLGIREVLDQDSVRISDFGLFIASY